MLKASKHICRALGPFVLLAAVSLPTGSPAQLMEKAGTSFDAATIKSVDSQNRGGESHEGGPGTDSPTLFRQQNATVIELMRVAWDIRSFRIVGLRQGDTNRFEVVARVPAGVSREEFCEMYRNLLIERFALKAHMENREMPVYDLAIASKGLKIAPDAAINPAVARKAGSEAGASDWHKLQPGKPGFLIQEQIKDNSYLLVRIQMSDKTLTEFARLLEPTLHRPVVDMTNTPGTYSFDFEYSVDLPGATASDTPRAALDLESALQSQLGLRVTKNVRAVEVVKVDSISPTPGSN